MYSRWFSTAVVLLWLSTMGWLVTEKVLPPLLLGDPPSHRSILEARRGEPAVSWLRGIINMVEEAGRSPSSITTDVANTLTIDASNRLSKIESTISFSPSGRKISLRGIVEDGILKLNIRSLDISFKTQIPIDDDALLCDSFSPVSRLPGLYEGQTWTISVLTPLKYPNRSQGILRAKVEGSERITWNGHPTEAWLVVYRDSLGKRPDRRAKLWVRRDGVVLKQEISILNSHMTFVRMADE